MRILVTGAAGFIGSHLTEALLRRGHEVRALVHYNSASHFGYLEALEPSPDWGTLDVRLGDVTDASMMRSLVEGCDAVLHLAALIGIPYSYSAPNSYVATNVIGTLNLLEACRHSAVRRVVVTSTSEVYGSARYTPIDEAHPLQAQSPYSATKVAADKLAESYFCSFDLPVVVLRPFNTYGPRQSARAVIPAVLAQALAGATEIRLGSLDPQRDLTFVEDTARAFVACLDAPGIEGEVIHFGQGAAVTIGELAQRCLAVVGSQARIVSAPERKRPERSEVGLLLCNADKARRLLGWSPTVSLDEGLRRTAGYVKAHLSQYKIERYAI